MLNSLAEKLKSIDKKTIIIGTAVTTGIVAIAGGGAYYSPYLTLNNMKNATENRNPDALSQEIDFPSLRVSIKDNIKAQILKQIAGARTATTAKMTPELVEKMVGPTIDKLVTPEGIEQLMQDKVPGAKIDLSNLDRDMAKSDIKMGYESLDRFVVHITDKVDRSKDVSLILKRDGLAWKLAGIDISKLVDS
ncbi:DUF2939 domain-containing protein [Chamaesiphon sp. VAR_48_metabat_135_sub]|uniref:DUF2939 domain-containing protein n=1 Tax=Chamaesiphon sp. VAR_48_metabat_135_sub TaxID=2964699 RepID=UPI00286CD9B4|nr:DUF2939 domain-containing protein [Chamaesiphon sp. VAR_48_metabat_135_sub]